MNLVTGKEMRTIDRMAVDSGIPALLLMENAGRALAEECRRLAGRQDLIAILAGSGQNGGDGFAAARHLSSWGYEVKVAFFGDPERLPYEAAENYKMLKNYPVQVLRVIEAGVQESLEALKGASLVADCLLGTGLKGNPRPPIDHAIHWANNCGAPIVACDVPSGLSSDTGFAYSPTVKASSTVTMGLPKLGMLNYPGRAYVGKIVVETLGLPPSLLSGPYTARAVFLEDARCAMPSRDPDHHKGKSGHVAVIAGSKGMAGAAVLAATSALRGGAGTVTLLCPGGIYQVCASMAPEIMVFPCGDGDVFGYSQEIVSATMQLVQRSSAVVLGPGFGRGDEQERFIKEMIPILRQVPTVVDADAIHLLSRLGGLSYLKEHKGNFILTPHPGEMAALLGTYASEIGADRALAARRAAEAGGCVVCLKGAGTVVSNDAGEVAINTTGGPAMATAGAGDVLAGVIAALIGQGLSLFESAWLGVFWHGLAGDISLESKGSYGITAGDIVEALPRARGIIDGRCRSDRRAGSYV